MPTSTPHKERPQLDDLIIFRFDPSVHPQEHKKYDGQVAKITFINTSFLFAHIDGYDGEFHITKFSHFEIVYKC